MALFGTVQDGILAVPDHRQHRGPHPEDIRLFAEEKTDTLRAATDDLVWLFNRGYPTNAALKLVGDRYRLVARQRIAVARCACGDDARSRRQQHQVSATELSGRVLWIDGYNVLTSLEAAMSGGVILHARDGCFRDMASMHGSYRKVQETFPALQILGEVLTELDVSSCHWLLDQPVSNSGRLKGLLQATANRHGWQWSATLVPDPDRELIAADHVVASSDSQILDRAHRWFNLARHAIETRLPTAWIVEL